MLGKKSVAFLHFCFSLSRKHVVAIIPTPVAKNLKRLPAACPACSSSVETGAEETLKEFAQLSQFGTGHLPPAGISND